MSNYCPFCEEYNQPCKSQFFLEIGEQLGYQSRILLESDNWYAIPTMGCLTVGYVLLVCKHHHLSLANLNFELYNEMLQLKSKVEKILFTSLGKKCIAFEHGITKPEKEGANSVDHVHVHILPYAQPIWNDITANDLFVKFDTIQNYDDLYMKWKIQKPDSYLLFQDIDKKIYYASNTSKISTQLFRRCLAPHLGVEVWDWKQKYYTENIEDTILLFKNYTKNMVRPYNG